MNKKLISLIVVIMFFVLGGTCLFALKSQTGQKAVVTKLYQTYKDGVISECLYEGNLVYLTSINAYDAADSIYNAKGENIATCNYAWGVPDKICEELGKCERIYVVEKNIWGYPPVNKYNLKSF